MRSAGLAWVLVLLFVALPVAQQRNAGAPGATANGNGVSAARLGKLDAVLQRYVDDKRIGGVVALVLRDGRPVYQKAFGFSDVEANRRMQPDTLFRIASQTKAITSVAILQLAEEGRLSINNPVGQFIPAYAKTTVAVQKDGVVTSVPSRRQITIRDLLTHTAGISYGTDVHLASIYDAKGLGPAAGHGWYTADKDEPVCDTMERLATLPFTAQPGESYVYGYSTDVLGCVVERASGLPLDQYIATRIAGPLGMKDTRFFLSPDQKDRLATVYTTGPGGALIRAAEGSRGQGHYIEGPRRNFAGGAGLVSTAPDYARFLEMLRRGGTLEGARILSPRSVALMTTNQITVYPTSGRGFGLGFETTDRYGANGMQSVGSFGWGGAYGTSYHVDPAERLVVVLMLQVLGRSSDVADRLRTVLYAALE